MYQQCLILLAVTSTVLCDKEKYVNKCCDSDQYLGPRKICKQIEYKTNMRFSQIKVYDENKNHIGKSVEDVFRIIPNRFDNDTFKKGTVNVERLNFKTYITETGVLIMELPNAYDRYTYINVKDYCIDYSLDPKTNKTTVPEYRVVLPINDNQGNLESKAYVAMMISCFFMMLVLIVYSLLKRLRNLSGLVLMSYISSLFLAFALLIDLQMNPSTKEKCLMLTLGIYYFFLASFCWMNVMSFDIWWGVRRPTQMSTFSRRKKLSRFLKYSLYAWGVPLCTTIFFVVVNSVDMSDYPWFVTPGVPDRGCFLLGGVKLLYLYYPLLILNFCNWLFFVLTLWGFLAHNRRTNVLDTAAAGSQQKHRQLKNQLILYSKLYVVMGLNWVLEVISFMYPDIKLLWQITDYYNILIGVSIFIIFVCKKKVLEESQRCLGTKLRGLHSSFVNFRSKEANPSGISMSVRPTSQTHHYSAIPETAV